MELPRWIQSDCLDSAAMLEAFEHYKYTCAGEAKEQLKHLYVIDHRSRSTVVLGGIPLAVQRLRDEQPRRQCRENPCARCGLWKGGYQFKWYNDRWWDTYITLHSRPRLRHWAAHGNASGHPLLLGRSDLRRLHNVSRAA